jgi:Protein of unknown function (DUF2975)
MRHSTALPLAWIALRILTIINWIGGAFIATLLIATLVAREWTFTALGIGPEDQTRSMIIGLQAIAALGLVAIPLNHAMFKRMLRIVETVRAGDPFVAANAYRLNAIAWILLALQVLSTIIGGIGRMLSTPHHPLHLDAGFAATGWLTVLLAFVLARVFAEGTLMREDLKGTI